MELLPNEQIIKQSINNEFTLTNFRIHQHYEEWDRFYTGEIFLEDISSIESTYRGWTILLIIGAILGIGGIITAMSSGGLLPLTATILGIICIGIWYSTRKIYVLVSPNGGNNLRFSMSKNSNIHQELVFNIEMAKLNRIKQLYNSKF